MSHRAMSHRPRAASLPVDPTRARDVPAEHGAREMRRRQRGEGRAASDDRRTLANKSVDPSRVLHSGGGGGGGVLVARASFVSIRTTPVTAAPRGTCDASPSGATPPAVHPRRRAPSPAGPARASTAFDASSARTTRGRARASIPQVRRRRIPRGRGGRGPRPRARGATRPRGGRRGHRRVRLGTGGRARAGR